MTQNRPPSTWTVNNKHHKMASSGWPKANASNSSKKGAGRLPDPSWEEPDIGAVVGFPFRSFPGMLGTTRSAMHTAAAMPACLTIIPPCPKEAIEGRELLCCSVEVKVRLSSSGPTAAIFILEHTK